MMLDFQTEISQHRVAYLGAARQFSFRSWWFPLITNTLPDFRLWRDADLLEQLALRPLRANQLTCCGHRRDYRP
jgi:hypothetical protein